MSWRHVRALTLVFLGLLLASPLSSGDKGLWLSLAQTPIQHLVMPAQGLPAEHSTVLPEKASRPVVAVRTERVDPSKSLGAPAQGQRFGTGERWPAFDLTPSYLHGELLASHPGTGCASGPRLMSRPPSGVTPPHVSASYGHARSASACSTLSPGGDGS